MDWMLQSAEVVKSERVHYLLRCLCSTHILLKHRQQSVQSM